MVRAWLNPLAGILLVALPVFVSSMAFADEKIPASPQDVVRPAGAVVVPEKFLRRWDPITVFFDADTGPAAGGRGGSPGEILRAGAVATRRRNLDQCPHLAVQAGGALAAPEPLRPQSRREDGQSGDPDVGAECHHAVRRCDRARSGESRSRSPCRNRWMPKRSPSSSPSSCDRCPASMPKRRARSPTPISR